jgi:ribosomal protein L7/L12
MCGNSNECKQRNGINVMNKEQSMISNEVLELIEAGKKLSAIQLVMQQNGLGLKEAKDIVDSADQSIQQNKANAY